MRSNKRLSKIIAILVYMAILFLSGIELIDAFKTGVTQSIFSMDIQPDMEPVTSFGGMISVTIYGASFLIGGFFLVKTIYDQR